MGAAPPCVGRFCISELNSHDLVHTFLPTLYWKSLDPFPIKMLPVLFFNYGRPIWKWVIHPAHASPSSSPSYSLSTYYFVIAGSIVRGQSKSGGPGVRAPWWGSGNEAPWSWRFSGAKIVIETLREYVFLCLAWRQKANLKLLMHENDIIFSYFPLVYWGGGHLPLQP